MKRFFLGYVAFIVVSMLGVNRWAALKTPDQQVSIETAWRHGQRIDRAAGPLKNAPPFDAWVSTETIVGEAPLLMQPLLFALNIVPGRDGVAATFDGRTVYATVDDLMSVQAYDRAFVIQEGIAWGTYRDAVVEVLAKQLDVSASDLLARGTFKRLRFERREAKAPPGFRIEPPLAARPARVTAENLSKEIVTDGLREAARHLASLVDFNGEFRYTIDAPTNRTINGYNWPRHAGATFFLAQAAHVLDDPTVRYACLRAGGRLRNAMVRQCGSNRCVAPDEAIVEIGTSALSLIAFTEIVRTKADVGFRPVIHEVAAFLRSQQRPDGELMHLYNRETQQPIDVQYLYYTGEAALGLARAHAVTNDPKDLDAAKRALSRLSGSGWNFFGSRYYYGEEHWTCQAVAELWERSPDPAALDFCGRWHEYQRKLQQDDGDSPFDSDGAFNYGPIATPRVTPASSRGEAAGALLAVYRKTGHPDAAKVDLELRRALGFVLRNQLHPGPAHLFDNPAAVRGALPGSPVDWQLRIDYAQHAGSMMVRWLELNP